ncbi:carbohydrate sulfotransferase 11-like [Ruditapes philippinarum]|uniref:carbohydrate sulfotransferase 11-like n=1 Tax=Ruditapes philippinarum TaxID=129788 RepID=UPI00295C30AC|nr:carbohydrate sulfotransferase 11-like [Ruditapes philippinarum]
MRHRMNKYTCALAIFIGCLFSMFTLRELRARLAGQTTFSELEEKDNTITAHELPEVKHVPADDTCDLNTTKHIPESDSGDSKTILNRFKARFNVLDTICSASKERSAYTDCDEENVKRNLKYSKHRKLVYCAIEKTGSTFWKRILYIIGGKSNVSNPTHIETVRAEYSEERFCDMTDKTWGEIRDIFMKSTNIMFVRHPYARLFSAWLDKFYSPNIIYWNSTGKAIAQSQRGEKEQKCANDITFTEFVNYTVDNILYGNTCIDRHFSPNFVHCNPCELSYDYIGKYETMKQDTLFILQALNLTGTVTFSQFDEDAASDAIKDAADWVYYQRDNIQGCGITFNCALFRVWKRLQSRGIISISIGFPFRNKENATSREDFEKALREAHIGSDAEELKRNKHKAMTQALMSLPENIKEKVLKAYERDFDMFEYDRYVDMTLQSNETFFTDCPTDL